MKLIKSLLIATASIVTISGCIATNLVGVSDTSFVVSFSKEQVLAGSPMYIIKSTSQLAGKCNTNQKGQAYIFWGGGCDFGRNPPTKIDIKYAKWKPYNQIPKPSYPYMKQFGDSLPDIAWQTYTIYPKKVMAKIKSGRDAKGTPIMPKIIAIKNITLTLSIDRNGNITTQDNYGYVYDMNDLGK